MGNLFHMNDFVAVSQGGAQNVLGEFLYFPLSNLLVEKAQLSELCESTGVSYSGGTRLSVVDAFRPTIGDIKERRPVTVADRTNVYPICRRNNKYAADALSWELVEETLNQKTNRYEKLANITCDRKDGQIYCTNIVMDPDTNVQTRYHRVGELFEFYQRHANHKQVEAICVNFLREIETAKLGINGHLYFVPRSHTEEVDTFENFIRLLGGMNRNNTPLIVSSFCIIGDEKQHSKMAEELCSAVKKEITEYQGRYDYFIKSNCQSPAVMERQILKVRSLEKRKRHYEEVLRRELGGLDKEFSTLKLLLQELRVRANTAYPQKAA